MIRHPLTIRKKLSSLTFKASSSVCIYTEKVSHLYYWLKTTTSPSQDKLLVSAWFSQTVSMVSPLPVIPSVCSCFTPGFKSASWVTSDVVICSRGAKVRVLNREAISRTIFHQAPGRTSSYLVLAETNLLQWPERRDHNTHSLLKFLNKL
jgi:hypothetical protein